MKKRLAAATLAGALSIVAATATPASAASDNHTTPGTFGEPDCVGQSIAYVTQGNSAFFGPGHGLGTFANAADRKAVDAVRLVMQFC